METTTIHHFNTFTQYGTKVTHLNKPANGVMAAIEIAPVGSTSCRFTIRAAKHRVGLSDTHCVITSSSVSGGGLKMYLFSASERSDYVHSQTIKPISLYSNDRASLISK